MTTEPPAPDDTGPHPEEEPATSQPPGCVVAFFVFIGLSLFLALLDPEHAVRGILWAAAGVLGVWSYRYIRQQRDVADFTTALQSLARADRAKVLESIEEPELRHALEGIVHGEDLENQGSVARFQYSQRMQAEVRSRFGVAVFFGALGAVVLLASRAVNPALNVLVTAWMIVWGVVAIRWRRHLQRLRSTFEISGFNITEQTARGDRRVLPWNQPLQLRIRPRQGCIEVGPRGLHECIRVDGHLVEFDRAWELIMEYGGFQPEEAEGA